MKRWCPIAQLSSLSVECRFMIRDGRAPLNLIMGPRSAFTPPQTPSTVGLNGSTGRKGLEMPYITTQLREKLDPLLDPLMRQGLSDGALNYCITQLLFSRGPETYSDLNS